VTLKEFIEKYEGVEVDFDNRYGAQCVDLVRFYWQKVCGLPRWEQPDTKPNGGAKDLINNLSGLSFRLTPSPTVGDVVVFAPNEANRYCGHVAVVIEIGDGNITVFEQDGINQGRGAYRKVRTTSAVIGYITMY